MNLKNFSFFICIFILFITNGIALSKTRLEIGNPRLDCHSSINFASGGSSYDSCYLYSFLTVKDIENTQKYNRYRFHVNCEVSFKTYRDGIVSTTWIDKAFGYADIYGTNNPT